MKALIPVLIGLLPLLGVAESKKSTKPNIIMLFADDWGYGDLGVFKNLSDVKTPHLDKLSEQGVLFTDAYITAPQCSPSRAGLLTGRYQQRFGFD
ncbi:MAG: sulfatase-like hydrolase/transferase, partial [Verrucomicrobiota bacterium]|nr:sulfatase-like hydrolase/transferase [Verrucomicrobiota bacterium]